MSTAFTPTPTIAPTIASRADGLLRDVRAGTGWANRRWYSPWIVVLMSAPLYGAAMGWFSVDSPARVLMPVYIAIKMPILIGATTLLCLPGFFVINSILGLRSDFGEAWRAITGAQAAMTLALLSLAPVTLFAYAGGMGHLDAVRFNAVMFTLATGAAQVVLFVRYRRLRALSPRHGWAMWFWVILYGFVGIQMGWMLRPFIGTPGKPVAFFREEPFSNAYVVIAKLLGGG
ncbi:hypothetical protein PHYC_03704 [Phycisphaerales bacterium]|nr:hypothetical protein PHYC_03704 [Phycisphaerales bacterium]